MSLISKIHSLPPGDCDILEEQEGEGGVLRITQHDRYRWLQIEDLNIQSLMDIHEPARLLSPTSVLMMMGLAFTKTQNRLLNLGLGGGAIERCVQANFPDLVIESVELDSRVADAAKKFFRLPDEQIIHDQEAEDFLSTCNDKFDFVFADLFSNGQSAPCVSSSRFFGHIEKCLSPGGVCVANLLFSSESALVNTLQVARAHLPQTWLVEVKGHQNVIAYFMRERLISDAILRKYCEQFLKELDVNKVVLDWELIALPIRA